MPDRVGLAASLPDSGSALFAYLELRRQAGRSGIWHLGARFPKHCGTTNMLDARVDALLTRAAVPLSCGDHFGGIETMYAIIRAGGKQAKVSEGDVIDVERLKVTDEITFTPLLVVDDSGKVISDREALAKSKVTAEILGEHRGDKVDVFKYKNKTGYRRRQGHRQTYTTIQVTSIEGPKAKSKKKAPAKAAKKNETKAEAKPEADVEAEADSAAADVTEEA
jgi:large subunit ribosomal protein L21